MGAPLSLSKPRQAAIGLGHLSQTIEILHGFEWDETKRKTIIRIVAISGVGMITPWNWPINQISCKVAPALAAGCTMVLKPTEIAPLNAILFAEVMDAAGVPAGVFNMINGDGPTVGEAMSSHPGIDMISFTGSVETGSLIIKEASKNITKVNLELGGKAPAIVLADADIDKAVEYAATARFANCGQVCTCNARLYVTNKVSDKLLHRFLSHD